MTIVLRQLFAAALLLQLVLLESGVQQAAAATPQQQQPKATSHPAPKPAAPKSSPPEDNKKRVDEFNKLDCRVVRCNRLDSAPVCATGKGIAGCIPPEKGCTYTNGCLARCVYSATVSYLGECTHDNAMRIVEQGPAQPGGKGCQCDYTFEPVCAKQVDCKIPGGCTYASECYAKCYGATDIKKGACPGDNAGR